MRIKVSDYIARFFVENGVDTIFTVVGGGAMHMNQSFGHHPNIHCIYNHHEQASSMAAEAFFRVNNKMAGVCVTSGPGAINALNGVAGAYQDSIPMIVLSGQCKSSLTVKKNGLNLRTLGPQEFDIISSLDNYTKFAETITNPNDVRYLLEKAFYIAQNGRPGPCWLEVPLDIQGCFVETDDLRYFECSEVKYDFETDIEKKIKHIINRINESKRPIIYAGNGVRIAGAKDTLHKLVRRLGVPVVTCWNSIDIISSDDRLYVGRAGTMGDRAGNFAVQNSDLLIAIGTRLNTYQVGYQLNTWARSAFVVMIDIDSNELSKPTIRVDLPICYDANEFIDKMLDALEKETTRGFEDWINQCNLWKEKYPVVTNAQKEQKKLVNVYAFFDKLSRSLPNDAITVVANGSASVVGSQAYYIKENSRFIMNCGISSMGYDLPAAIGACVSNGNKPIICIAGDGSIQMNIQELQTIVTNKLPIKIVVINNQGYHQIRITQTNLFDSKFIGVGPISMDLGFPDFGKLASAYGIPYAFCDSMVELDEAINWLNAELSFCLLEIHCDNQQFFEPKSATKKMENGMLYSPPLEDLAPFLTREELKDNMIIELWDEA